MTSSPTTTTDQEGIEELTKAFTSAADFPLTVVTTTSVSDGDSGCIVGFTTQCSIEPVRFLVCISKQNHTFDVVSRSEVLALHLLGEDQVELAELFGEETGDQIHKFKRCPTHPGTTGAPLLDDCVAWIEGTIDDRHDVGDHVAMVVTATSGGRGNQSGLMMFQRSPDMTPGHPAD